MSKIRFIFAIILSLSIISNELLAEEIYSLESVPSELIRKKRHVEDMNLKQLFENPAHYPSFISRLRDIFAAQARTPEGLRTTRNDDITTLVTLNGEQGSVQLVFDNSHGSVWVAGFIVDGRFYREQGSQVTAGINQNNIVDLGQNLNYNSLITNYDSISFNSTYPDDLIRPLIDYHQNRNTLGYNLGPFRIALARLIMMTSEAVRLDPMRLLIQDRLYAAQRSFSTAAFRLSNTFREYLGSSSIPEDIQVRQLLDNWASLSQTAFGTHNPIETVRVGGFSIARNLVPVLVALFKYSCVTHNGPSGRSARDTEHLSPDQCHPDGREGIVIGNTYWDNESASILISEILDTHIIYGVSSTIYVRDEI